MRLDGDQDQEDALTTAASSGKVFDRPVFTNNSGRQGQVVDEVIKKQIGKTFHTCDKCNYQRGFHVSFEKADSHHEIVLICPNCGQRFRVGWKFTPIERS
jgi:hypothetical protein